jgi:hypothetical protein
MRLLATKQADMPMKLNQDHNKAVARVHQDNENAIAKLEADHKLKLAKQAK